MLIEVELLLDWYLPHVVGKAVSGSVRAEFLNLWSEALGTLADGPRTWVLRDYHSPNLIWLPERDGVRRVGLIDFQDAAARPAGLRRRLAPAGRAPDGPDRAGAASFSSSTPRRAREATPPSTGRTSREPTR